MALVDPAPALDTALFEQAPVGLAFLDLELRYLRLNQALAEINHLPVEAHLGRSVSELWPDLDPAAVESLRQVIATGRPIIGVELDAETPDAPGVVRSFVQAYHPVRDVEGTVIGVNASVVEVTRLRRAEAEAQRAREAASLLAQLNGRLAATASETEAARLVVDAIRAAFGAHTAGMFLVEGDQLRSVAAAGYSDEIVSALGTYPLSASSPAGAAIRAREARSWNDLAAVRADFPELAEVMAGTTGEQAIVACPLIVGDEVLGSLHLGFEKALAPRDEVLMELRAAADVAAQAIARMRLVDSERRARQMLVASVDQMPTGVIVADSAGAIVHANDESRRIWEGPVAAGSVSEYGAFSGFHLDNRPYMPDEWPLARSIATGEVVVDEEVRIRTHAGTARVITVSSAPIADASGARLGGVAVFSDVTERRHAEQLREAFLGMLSHELRTPVTSIYGAASLLARRGETLEAETRTSLTHDMEDAAAQLLQLVENLLVIARAERGLTRLDPAPMIVRRVVERIVRQEAASWPSVRIGVEAPDDMRTVLADEAVVELLLRNLISNAAKYAGGDVTILVEADEAEVRVAVLDRGRGIPESEAEQVFELFHRSAATAKLAPGSGIGLYVVRHLAVAQGGRAWARPRPGGGAEVGFSLPIALDEEF